MVQREVLARAGIDPGLVGQVIGGCVAQVGEQAFDVTRTAWLSEGLPEAVGATTVDAQCGSSQEALTLATGLVRGGLVDVAMACGVESMSRIPIGSTPTVGLSLSAIRWGLPAACWPPRPSTNCFGPVVTTAW
jgi:acetyl-CoA C-acetyltransferase